MNNDSLSKDELICSTGLYFQKRGDNTILPENVKVMDF